MVNVTCCAVTRFICHFGICRAFALSSLVLFPLQIHLHILAYSLLGMPEVHLKENWRKYPSWYQTSWRSMRISVEEDEIGTGAIQTPWPLMRHQVRVKESKELKELKVVEERSLKCSRRPQRYFG